MPSINTGDIFLTRNMGNDEDGNPSPGYWNHCAIYIGNDIVVESQGFFGVVKTKLENFVNRYPAFVQIRREDLDGNKSAEFARKMVGKPYRKIASVFLYPRHSDLGENCVSLVRKCIWFASGKDPGYKIPDDLYNDPQFKKISKKFDKNWVAPAEKDFWGIIKE